MTDSETEDALKTWAAVGKKVRVVGTTHVATVREHYDQKHYKGGLMIDPPVDDFYKSWNVDSLVPSKQ